MITNDPFTPNLSLSLWCSTLPGGILLCTWFLTCVCSLLSESRFLIMFSWTSSFQYLMLGCLLPTQYLLFQALSPLNVLIKIMNGFHNAKSDGHVLVPILTWYLKEFQWSWPPFLDILVLIMSHAPGFLLTSLAPPPYTTSGDKGIPPTPTFSSPV